MKVYVAKHSKPEQPQYFNGSKVSAVQADAIKTLGGTTSPEPNDKDIWRNWT